MKRIHQLPAVVVNQIAAGEVIERPASVVKELLENALDAGSRRVDVELEQGGTERICVVDDGGGIHPDDLALAFASHATSKLRDSQDLAHIATLGFRGEALASIGSVAQVTLQSRPADLAAGAQIACQGGVLGAVRAWNGSPGTRIEVRHLFYNTPVRRKFLRAAATEMGHVSEIFTRLAVAHARSDSAVGPGLHLTLRHNGKLIHDVTATTTLLDRIGLFFGPEVRGQTYALEARQGASRLWGYLADPACERGNSRMQYLFVNGRWVRDRSLGHALQEAYRGLLMTGRYAVAFLFLEVPPELVDVNVHPTKSEVRFREAQALHHLVFSAVRERLRAENLVARLQVPSTVRPSVEVGAPVPASGASAAAVVAEPALPFQNVLPRVVAPPELPPTAAPVEDAPRAASLALRGSAKVIQLYDAYLVLETEQGMLVIDQHALHERILFDQLKRRLQSGTLETQRLLIPEPVELSAEQAARTLEQRTALVELGLGVEDFGGDTILLTSYPVLLGNRSPRSVLQLVVDHLLARDRTPSREVLFNDLLSLMACHAAVRAGDRLTSEQIEALLAQRHLADDAHHCPHGRPTALLFSRHDLDRQFRRI